MLQLPALARSCGHSCVRIIIVFRVDALHIRAEREIPYSVLAFDLVPLSHAIDVLARFRGKNMAGLATSCPNKVVSVHCRFASKRSRSRLYPTPRRASIMRNMGGRHPYGEKYI